MKYGCDKCPYRPLFDDTCQEDIIKMNTDTDVCDKDGNKLAINVPPPDYMPEPFGKQGGEKQYENGIWVGAISRQV